MEVRADHNIIKYENGEDYRSVSRSCVRSSRGIAESDRESITSPLRAQKLDKNKQLQQTKSAQKAKSRMASEKAQVRHHSQNPGQSPNTT